MRSIVALWRAASGLGWAHPTRTAPSTREMRSAFEISAGLDLVEAGPLGPVLAVRHPREEQKAAAHEHDRRAQPDPEPDRVEDEDPHHAEQEDRDRGTRVLEVEAHRVRVYEDDRRRRNHW
jgi:hypothetical protein